jgi:PAS domain S-box-containing protein
MVVENTITTEPRQGISGISQDALGVLIEASSALLSVSDVATTLGRILQFARQLVAADGYAVWRCFESGTRWQMLASEGLQRGASNEFVVSDTEVAGEILFAEDVFTHPWLAPRVEWYKAEGICSLVAVRLWVEGEVRGSIVFYYRETHSFAGEEIGYAKLLANLSASALYTSELHEAQQRERTRLNFLAEASSILFSSLHYERTLDTIAHLAVPHLADGCTVSLYEGNTLAALAIAHVDPDLEHLHREFDGRFFQKCVEGSGSAKVMATGRPVLRAVVTDEYLVSASPSAGYLEGLRAMELCSQILLPLKIRERVIGVMRLFTDRSRRRFTEDDLYFAEDLALRASMAIENAHLFRERSLSEARYRSLIEAASSLAFTTDPMGGFAEPQPAWSAYCGQTWEEAHGFGWAAALHPEDRQRMIDEVREAVLDPRPHGNKARLWHASSGSYRHCTVRAVPMIDDEGSVLEWVGVIADVHNQTLAEEQLRRTEQLAMAGRLAATVAHEINNPLESVTNLIYLAQQAENLNAETKEYLQTASDEMQRAAQIVRQTLGFYRESASPKDADIGEIARGVLHLYRRNFLSKEIDVTEEIDAGCVACVVPGEIRQVIANLIANAIDASSLGSSMRVAVKCGIETIEIDIADKGSGIAEEHLGRLFEPFFTTKKDLGTGLGLWVSRGLIEKHRGALTLETKTGAEDHGTTFRIVLPVDGSIAAV